LLLVMLAPAFGPLAMACVTRPETMHCVRLPMAVSAEQPAMPCHHAMAQSNPSRPGSSQGESSEPSFQDSNSDNCCQNHCCCGATISEWARPVSSLLSFLSLLIEPTLPLQSSVLPSSDISGQDCARAPPNG
jgi:hypothetical protein